MTTAKIVSFFLVMCTLHKQTPAYTTSSNKVSHFLSQQKEAPNGRRRFLEQTVSVVFGVAASSGFASPAMAVEEIVLPTKEAVTTAFDSIRYELQNPAGGVSIMQSRIDAQDFVGLMEFTRTYDLELRKLRMGKAKKLLQSKELKEQATSYANAVTFDLIGINRNSRSGQENVEGANKYLQELRDDVAKFLALENTIQTEG
mmetsp:Transcript_97741/g.273535  ORF Transcript_97741/g.273535 Transcript_97741/m.273535 type:complete len:201 (-) Transcript_97741:195-797(-)